MISYLHKLLPTIHEILKESSPPHLMPQNHVGILLFLSDTGPSIATAPQHTTSCLKSMKKSSIITQINVNEIYQIINLYANVMNDNANLLEEKTCMLIIHTHPYDHRYCK